MIKPKRSAGRPRLSKKELKKKINVYITPEHLKSLREEIKRLKLKGPTDVFRQMLNHR